MMPNGYLHVTITSKLGTEVKPLSQQLTFQLRPLGTLGNPQNAIPTNTEDVFYVNQPTCASTAGKAANLYIEGYSNEGNRNHTVAIGNDALAQFMNSNIIARCRAIQSQDLVYKKFALSFFFSKGLEGVRGNGTLSSLRQYDDAKVTLPPTIFGNIEIEKLPAIGAISINMYPGTFAETPVDQLRRFLSDKPGRFLIRGGAISNEDALRGTQIMELTNFFMSGGTIGESAVWALRPVVAANGDLWTIRSAQSAGYTRVAAQGNKNPRVNGNGGGMK